MSDNVLPFKQGSQEQTPQDLLNSFSNDNDIEAVVIVVLKKGITESFWSPMTNAEMAFAGKILDLQITKDLMSQQ